MMNSVTVERENAPIIVGADHGFGNIKTARACFQTGVSSYDKEPTFKSNLLTYEGRYYIAGEEHKEFSSEKASDNDNYILTLAAIARELDVRGLTSARVHIAAGLPLTRVTERKDAFRAYLLQNPTADFTFRGTTYHGADMFPQGFDAVAERLKDFNGIFRANVNVRYRHAGAAATLERFASDTVRVRFDSPVKAATPGQSAVFYDNQGHILGGGVIVKAC